MRYSKAFIQTSKSAPAAELTSHRLMLQAGLIRQMGSGLYAWLPLGYRVLQKVSQVVREEMNRVGALEVCLPLIQPADLWQETGRWETFGPLMLTMTDRAEREYCFGPTHEEIATDLIRREVQSYKQLPICVYQIQPKFRDEIRPRFGVMRAREFLMKDAYSFHFTPESLASTYQAMHGAYSTIFTRLGLKFRVVWADSGAIGGENSQEFHVLADSGEDTLAYCPDSDYAANLERATSLEPEIIPEAAQPLAKISCQATKTPEQCAYLKIDATRALNTYLVRGSDTPYVLLCLRSDDTLNETKVQNLPQVAKPLTLLPIDEYPNLGPTGFLGPIGVDCPVLVDRRAYAMQNFMTGANEANQLYQNANWQRDCSTALVVDIRNVCAGDQSPDGKGPLALCKGIEVGHIFQLGTKYSEAMHANVLNDAGTSTTLSMGCYGIGVSRIVAACIEQNHDDRGIIWPAGLAPYQVVIIPMQRDRSPEVQAASDTLYDELTKLGIDVLYDDRDERPGAMFADADLLGIPHRVVISQKSMAAGMFEYKGRTDAAPQLHPQESFVSWLQDKLK
ncbi:MAG: proline--tRNA ligase [Pseudomonadota bacterium]